MENNLEVIKEQAKDRFHRSEIGRAEQLRSLRKGKCVIAVLAQRGADIPCTWKPRIIATSPRSSRSSKISAPARASSSNRSSAKPTSPRRKLAALRNAVISGGYSNEGIIVAGRPLPPPGQERGILLNKIEGDFFHAAGCAILRGRDFSPRDTPASPKVAIIT
jgi:hypothetical protein